MAPRGAVSVSVELLALGNVAGNYNNGYSVIGPTENWKPFGSH